MKNGGGIKLFLLDLIFPNRCPFCGDFIAYDSLCCEKCFGEILWADENICIKCGKPAPEECICGRGLRYDMCLTAAYYKDKAKEGIYDLKFRSGTNAAEVFGRVLAGRLEALSLTDKIDVAVPVPMSARQRRMRGYNQAELIARAIVRDTGIPVETGVLMRENVSRAQHLLGAQERSESVKEQYFAAEGISLAGKTVLLTDDVITTGSTLDRCAMLLKESLGAEKVICAAAATTI